MHYNKIRILVNDDQEIFREGVLHLIRSEQNFILCGSLEPEGNLVEFVAQQQPDILITTAQHKHMDCIEAVRNIRERFPHIGIIAVCTFPLEHSVMGMVRAGVKGCLLRNTTKTELLQTIRIVYRMEDYFSHEIRIMLTRIIANSGSKLYLLTDFHQLTEKDKLLLSLLCKEFTVKEISLRLKVSVRTIEHRKNRLYQLVGKTNIAGLVNYAIVNGLHNPF